MNVENLSLKRALVDTEVHKKKPCEKECACLRIISAHKCRVGPMLIF